MLKTGIRTHPELNFFLCVSERDLIGLRSESGTPNNILLVVGGMTMHSCVVGGLGSILVLFWLIGLEETLHQHWVKVGKAEKKELNK